MRGVIDIGSNTMRLAMYRTDTPYPDLLFSRRIAASLAAYIDEDSVMSDEGILRAIEVLEEFSVLLGKLDDPPVTAIATAGLRNIENSDEAVRSIEQASGMPITVLSGDEEAFFVSYAVRNSMDEEPLLATDTYLVVDIGGGSTELVVYRDDDIADEASFPIGSLNQYLRHVDYLLPTRANRLAIEANVAELVANHFGRPQPAISAIAGVGGSIRGALRLYNTAHEFEQTNRIMTADGLEELISSFDADDKECIVRLSRVAPDRIHTLLPGMIILHGVATAFGADSIGVSHWGLREGYLLYRMRQEDFCD